MNIGEASTTAEDEAFMRRCLALARASAEAGESAVGSLIVWQGIVVGEGMEATKGRGDPTAHSEIEAVRAALQTLGRDFSGCTLYTTVEPCFMCAYVMRQARIRRVVIGTAAGEIGAVQSNYPLLRDDTIQRWGDAPEIVFGVLEAECRRVLHGDA